METVKDKEWYNQANCATTDPEIMTLEKGGSTKLAKAVCARCLVIEDCLISAIQERDFKHTVRGGMTGRERKIYANQEGVGRAS